MCAEVSREPVDYLFVYTHGVDEKRRVQIQSKWRPPPEQQRDFKLRLLLWKPPGQPAPCLLALPPDKWRQLREKLAARAFSDPKAEAVRSWVAENCDVVDLDSAGRICLPQELAAAAGITRQAVLRGMTEYYQLWSPENYKAPRPPAVADPPATLGELGI
jgi:MraZ protein